MKWGLTTAIVAFVVMPMHVLASDTVKQEKTSWTELSCRAFVVGFDVTKLSPLAKAVVLELPALRAAQKGTSTGTPHRSLTDLESQRWDAAIKQARKSDDARDFHINLASNSVIALLDAGYSTSKLVEVAKALTPRISQKIALIGQRMFEKGNLTIVDLFHLSLFLAALNDPMGLMATTQLMKDALELKPESVRDEARSVEAIVDSILLEDKNSTKKTNSLISDLHMSEECLFLPGDGFGAHALNLLAGLPVSTIRTSGSNVDSFSNFLYDAKKATQYSSNFRQVSVVDPELGPSVGMEDRYLALASGYLTAYQQAEDGAAAPVVAALKGLFFLATQHADAPLSVLPEKYGGSRRTVLNYLHPGDTNASFDLTVPQLLTLLNETPEIRSLLGIREDVTVHDLFEAAELLSAAFQKPNTNP